MWNCSLKSLPEARGLITAPWQAKRNIANQIHKKVGHLLSRPKPPPSFAPFSLQICPIVPSFPRRLLFMHDKRRIIHLRIFLRMRNITIYLRNYLVNCETLIATINKFNANSNADVREFVSGFLKIYLFLNPLRPSKICNMMSKIL